LLRVDSIRFEHSRGDANVPLETALLTQKKLVHSVIPILESDEHFSPALLDAFVQEVVANSGAP